MKSRLPLSAFLIIITLLPQLSLALSFAEHVIIDGLEPVNSVFPVDIDRDGDLDIVCATAGRVSWFENEGDGSLVEQIVLEDLEYGLDVRAMDFDIDGDIDILVAISTQFMDEPGSILWLENDGAEGFEEHTVTDDFVGASHVAAADMDGDGDMDVIGSSWYSTWLFDILGSLFWWENQGEEGFTEHVIVEVDSAASGFEGFINIEPFDIDFDDDLDIITGKYGSFLRWFENDGEGSFEDHELPDSIEGLSSVVVTDIDGDDDQDFIACGLIDQVAWWENDGDLDFSGREIGRYVGCGCTVDVADINDDGNPDVVAAGGGNFAELGAINWWSNQGEGIFYYHRITNSYRSPTCVKAVDIDGDGDVDVISGSSRGNISWWEQTEGDEDYDTLTVCLDAGWSIVSLPAIPWVTDIEELFRLVVDNNNLVIMKDYRGRFWLPGQFNGIHHYNVDEGYAICLNESDTLTVIGYEVVPWRILHLPEGWSNCAYFPGDTVDARTAFYFFNLFGYLTFAKDDKGRFYIPAWGFCNMAPLTRGNGYQVLMSRYWQASWNTEPRE